jgi:hypothetical protein
MENAFLLHHPQETAHGVRTWNLKIKRVDEPCPEEMVKIRV